MPAYIDLRCHCENCGFEYTELDQMKRFKNTSDDTPIKNRRNVGLNTAPNTKICPKCGKDSVIEINMIVAGVHMWREELGHPSQEQVIAEEEARVARLKQQGIEDKENKGIDPETGLEV